MSEPGSGSSIVASSFLWSETAPETCGLYIDSGFKQPSIAKLARKRLTALAANQTGNNNQEVEAKLKLATFCGVKQFQRLVDFIVTLTLSSLQ